MRRNLCVNRLLFLDEILNSYKQNRFKNRLRIQRLSVSENMYFILPRTNEGAPEIIRLDQRFLVSYPSQLFFHIGEVPLQSKRILKFVSSCFSWLRKAGKSKAKQKHLK